jgi:hypothetical protein
MKRASGYGVAARAFKTTSSHANSSTRDSDDLPSLNVTELLLSFLL